MWSRCCRLEKLKMVDNHRRMRDTDKRCDRITVIIYYAAERM